MCSPESVKNYTSNQCFKSMIRRNHVKNCLFSEKSLKLEVKWHLNIQAADKMIPVLSLANHFHLITEHKYSHSMMKNFFIGKMSCHLLLQSSLLSVCSTHMRPSSERGLRGKPVVSLNITGIQDSLKDGA